MTKIEPWPRIPDHFANHPDWPNVICPYCRQPNWVTTQQNRPSEVFCCYCFEQSSHILNHQQQFQLLMSYYEHLEQSDEVSLLEAVAEKPDDDLPRLVYADYLEESGLPDLVARAEFIRKQIALARLPRSTPEFDRLYRDSEQLFDVYANSWLERIGLRGDVQRMALMITTWERGFIEGMVMSVADLDFYSRLFAPRSLDRLPVRHLTIRRNLALEADATSTRNLTRFKQRITQLRLAFADRFNDTFLIDPCWQKLHTLDLSENPLSDEDMILFIRSVPRYSFAQSLRVLDISRCTRLTAAAFTALASARWIDQLDRLNVTGNRIGTPAYELLRRRLQSRLMN